MYMYMYLYMHMYRYMYVYLYMQINTCSSTCTDVHVNVPVHIHVPVHVLMYMYMCRNMKIYMIKKKDRVHGRGLAGEKSEEAPVDSGVPQGTVLGPTLFSIFIDDLEEEIKRCKLEVKVVKFADDTKGGKIITTTEDRDKLQMALDCLCDWAEKWGMSFNLAKCKIMHIGPNNPCYEYFMRGTKLGTTDEERDIGVTITKNLKPSVHCSKAAGRASPRTDQTQLSLPG
jgi:hypothetical protein